MTFHPTLRRAVFNALRLPGINPLGKAILSRLSSAQISRLPFVFPAVGKLPVRLPDSTTFYMKSDGSDSIASRAYLFGAAGFEPETVSVFLQLIQRSRSFFDIGANTGIYSLIAGCHSGVQEIHAFEPAPHVCEILRENLRINGFTTIHANAVALGDDHGEIELSLPVGITLPTGGSTDPTRYREGVLIPCPLMRLDTYVEEAGIKSLDLIKMDTEATEHLVLAGASRTLDEFKPIIICEVVEMSVSAKVQEAISRHPYRFFHIKDTGLVRTESIQADPTLAYMNYLLVPESKLDWVQTLTPTPTDQ